MLIGRAQVQQSSQVFDLPQLPYPLYKGSIKFADGMTRSPSGSITYPGITEVELPKLEAAYALGTIIHLSTTPTTAGCPLEVVNRSYSQEDVVYRDEIPLVVYTVTIALQYPSAAVLLRPQFGERWQAELERREKVAQTIGFLAYSDGLQPKAFGSGAVWQFLREQITEVGGNSVAVPSEGYNRAVLSWGGDDTARNNRTEFSPKRPVIEEFTEQSDDPTSPPLDTKILRDTSSNFDESGPTKFVRVVRRVDGTSDRDTYKLYGFAYLQENILNDQGLLREENPQRWWRVVEETETQYIYSKVDIATLQVSIRAGGRLIGAIVHPDYKDFLISSGGGLIRVQSNARYMVSKVTRGRKLVRLVKETEGRNTLDNTDPRYSLMQFKWTPFYERTAYLLQPSRGVFVAEDESLPFRVEFADYESLEPRIKAIANPGSRTDDGKVAILYPDPAYQEPFYIAQEQQQASSYEWALDPDGEIGEPEQEGDPPPPPPHFQVGQETDNLIKRIPTDPANQRYSEQAKTWSAQDPQFIAVAEQLVFSDMKGTPPGPETRIREFEPDSVDPNDRAPDTSVQWLVTTPDIANRLPEGGSVSIEGASNLSQAQAALQVQLRRSGLQSAQADYTVAWYYPTLRPGDYVDIEGDRHAAEGRWMVDQIDWELKYEGSNTPLGTVAVSCEGTKLKMGLDRPRVVTIEPRTTRNNQAPTIRVKAVTSAQTIGRILPPLPNRRNP